MYAPPAYYPPPYYYGAPPAYTTVAVAPIAPPPPRPSARRGSALPGRDAKWLEVRVQFRPGLVRVWLDDRLVGTNDVEACSLLGACGLNTTTSLQQAAQQVVAAARG